MMKSRAAESWDWYPGFSAHRQLASLAHRLSKPLGGMWFAAAVLTWLICPNPAPHAPAATARLEYAQRAGYFVECLSLWPAIAYYTGKSRS